MNTIEDQLYCILLEGFLFWFPLLEEFTFLLVISA